MKRFSFQTRKVRFLGAIHLVKVYFLEHSILIPSSIAGSIPSTMEPPTPASQVFATTELLEGILLDLPMKDLLFVQGECTGWKAVIDASPKLQQALFFPPVTDKVSLPVLSTSPTERHSIEPACKH